jgi:phospholipid/cholesterol/gamma-HCH transport system substrate-binding protein
MGRNLIETVMGAVVLVVAGVFIAFAYNTAGLNSTEGYPLIAKFDRIDGLNDGSDVRLSGIKIGTVVRQRLDPKTYLAVVTLNIEPGVKLPLDSSAQISSEGLLGSKYLSVTPGAEEQMLKPGAEIQHTQGSIDLISLVGRLIFGQATQATQKQDQNAPQNGGHK